MKQPNNRARFRAAVRDTAAWEFAVFDTNVGKAFPSRPSDLTIGDLADEAETVDDHLAVTPGSAHTQSPTAEPHPPGDDTFDRFSRSTDAGSARASHTQTRDERRGLTDATDDRDLVV